MITRLFTQNYHKINYKLLLDRHKTIVSGQVCRLATSAEAPNTASDTNNWVLLYRLAPIRFVAALNKIKFYQFGLTAIGIPSTCALENLHYISDGSCAVFSTVGITGSITLLLLSLGLKNLIGHIYIDKKNYDSLKISYIDFWGKRRNAELCASNLIPPVEMPQTKLRFFTMIKEADGQVTYKLLIRFGQISDPETFVNIFGD